MDHQDLREFPFFKVSHANNVYIFVGTKYKDLYLSNPRLQKGVRGDLKIHYVKETIFHDDPLCTVRSKIIKGLGLATASPLYMWCKQRLKNPKAATITFLENVYGGRRLVSNAELAEVFHHVTGKKLAAGAAASMTFEDACEQIVLPQNVLKTLGFQRMDGSLSHYVYFPIDPADWTSAFALPLSTLVDEHAMLIGDHVVNNVIYIATTAPEPTIYFPQLETTSIAFDTTQMEEMRDFSRKPAAKISCYPSFIQVRVQGHGLENTLFKTFTQIDPTPEIPFMRWMSVSNTLYKLHKSYMTKYNERAMGDLQTWTKPAKYFEASKEHLIAKIPLSPTNIATLIVESDGSYNIRINYRKNSNASLTTVMNHILTIYKTFSVMKVGPLTPPDVKHLWTGDGNVTISKMICGGKMSDNENASTVNKIESAIASKLNHVFVSQSSRPGFVELIYKRFNGFAEVKNILQFMNKFNTLDKNGMISLITQVFSLEKEYALSVYTHWVETQKNKSNFYTKRIVKLIKVVLRPRKNLYEFAIDGATSLIQVRRILHALMYLSHISKEKGTGKKTAVVPASAGPSSAAAAAAAAASPADEDEQEGFVFDLDKDDLDQFFHESDDDDDESENDDHEYDDAPVENIDSIKRSKVCPSGGGLLSRLKEADKKLFSSNKEKRKRYSTTCQGSDKRYPVVISKDDVEYNNKCFPGALTGVLNIGSTPELERKNFYTCPKVWCPKTRIALTMEQFKTKYHGKCPFPNINEEPQVIDTNKWKGRDRHIMYLSPTRHSKNLCMPCCGLKPLTEKNNKCVTITQSSNTKYIKDRGSLPLEEGRYGLLPLKMTEIFGNEFCGDKGGQHGLMNEQTNCYLRFGLPPKNQVLFQCMIACLDNDGLKTSQDVVDTIVANLDMQQFLTLGNGIVCKSFMPVYNSAHEAVEFEAFRGWFLGKEQEAYRQRFNLNMSVAENLKRMTNLSLDDAKKPRENLKRFYKEILREFQLFQSFQAYLAYIRDDMIVKTHDHIFHLFSFDWLNPNKYNVIILEEDDENAFVACPIYLPARHVFDAERPSVILLKQGPYYEPIHHVTYDKVNHAKRPSQFIHRVHMGEPRIKRVIDKYLGSCTDSYFDEHGEQIWTLLDASAHAVKAQVLDFKFHVVAFYTRTNVIIPLKQPIAMNVSHPSTFIFIDTCLKDYKFNLESRFVKGILNAINKLIPGYYKSSSVLKINGSNAALKLQDIDILIPLKPYYDITESGIYEQIVKDGAIFTMYEENDPRKSMVSMNKYIEILFATLKNEIVNLILHIQTLKEIVHTLRHPSNPMPTALKRRVLIDALAKYVQKIVFKGAVSTDATVSEKANMVSGQRGMVDKCSTIGALKMCVHQCSKVVIVNRQGNKTSPQCKLSVPSDYYDLLLERCYEFILNPISNLKIEKVVSEAEMVNNDVIVFSRHDLDKGGVNAILEKISRVGTMSFENVMVNAVINAAAADAAAVFENMVAIDKPTLLAQLTDFGLWRIVDRPTWLLELFTIVNRRINPKMANMTQNDLKLLMLKKIKSSYRADPVATCERFFEGKHAHAAATHTEAQLMAWAERSDRMITEAEIEILSAIVSVNVFLTSRQTKRNPDKMRCLGKHKRDYYLFLHQSSVNQEFQLYMKKPGNKYLLTRADFGERFSKCVLAKCTRGYVSGDVEDVCPPYKSA